MMIKSVKRGPSIFMPRELKTFKAVCRTLDLEYRIARGGGFKAMWFASTKGTLGELLAVQQQMGWGEATDAYAVAKRVLDAKILKELGIEEIEA